MQEVEVQRNVFLIGTIHGHTPHDELVAVLERCAPDQLFVELPSDAPENFAENKDIRDEMWCAYEWGRERGIETVLFDQYQSLFREGYGPESPEYAEFLKQEDEVWERLEGYTWKDFNRSEINAQLDVLLSDVLFDPEKARIREEKMLKIIQAHIRDEGNIVIVTGAGHLEFFKESFPDTQVPLAG